jgi:hypothetical protein
MTRPHPVRVAEHGFARRFTGDTSNGASLARPGAKGRVASPDVSAAIERLRQRTLVGADVTPEWSQGAPVNSSFRAVPCANHLTHPVGSGLT